MERPANSGGSRLPEFRVSGDAGKWGQIRIEARWFSFTCAQRIRREGVEEMFESVGFYCTQELDGALVVRVIIFNPDWGAPLQIARIESRPDDPKELLVPLGFNLDHVELENFK